MSEADGGTFRHNGRQFEIVGRVGTHGYHCVDMRSRQEKTFGTATILGVADADLADMIRADQVRADDKMFAELETYDENEDEDEDGAFELEEDEEYRSLELLLA